MASLGENVHGMGVGTTDNEMRVPSRSGCSHAVAKRNPDPQAADSMPSQEYLIVFAQAHENFRVPELLSIAELYGFSLNIENDFDPSRPFGILILEQEAHVRLLARRCILIKYVAVEAYTEQ